MDFLLNNFPVAEENINIVGIPCIRLIPKGREGKLPSVIFYHGLGSSKENQRLRGYILAFAGYQVFLPDGLHHGERDSKETEDPVEISKYFWQAILQSLRESDVLIDSIINDYRGQEDNIIVTGHSMGGFTAGGVLTHNKRVRAGIPLNGSLNWKKSNYIIKKASGYEDKRIEEEDEAELLDPINHLDKLRNKKLLIVHGEEDREVDIKPQEDFYREARSRGLNPEFIKYDGLGHFVTTNMMEDMIKWMKGL